MSGTSHQQLRRPHALARWTMLGCANSTAAGSTRVKKPPTDHLTCGGEGRVQMQWFLEERRLED